MRWHRVNRVRRLAGKAGGCLETEWSPGTLIHTISKGYKTFFGWWFSSMASWERLSNMRLSFRDKMINRVCTSTRTLWGAKAVKLWSAEGTKMWQEPRVRHVPVRLQQGITASCSVHLQALWGMGSCFMAKCARHMRWIWDAGKVFRYGRNIWLKLKASCSRAYLRIRRATDLELIWGDLMKSEEN